jgi:hypothetical protein
LHVFRQWAVAQGDQLPFLGIICFLWFWNFRFEQFRLHGWSLSGRPSVEADCLWLCTLVEGTDSHLVTNESNAADGGLRGKSERTETRTLQGSFN